MLANIPDVLKSLVGQDNSRQGTETVVLILFDLVVLMTTICWAGIFSSSKYTKKQASAIHHAGKNTGAHVSGRSETSQSGLDVT